MARQTKIVATLGPATDDRVGELIEAGMDCARINCSYGSPEDWRRRVEEVRAVKRPGRCRVPVMFDLQGPKMRLVPSTADTRLTAGLEVRLAGDDGGPRTEEGATLEVDHAHFTDLVGEGSEIVIGDGTPRLAARSAGPEVVVATVTAPGRIGPGKGVTVLRSRQNGVSFTDKDEADLAEAAATGAEFVAASYVSTAEDVLVVRQHLRRCESDARVIAKIERIEAYENLTEILEVADGVMVARGDLGVAVGIERVPLIQKDVIRRATQLGKLVITATQMLESMIGSPEPTRAEATDVANAVIDGTSAVMLSAETSTGIYPVEAVTKMAAIAAVAETEDIRGASGQGFGEEQDVAVMHAALYLSHATGASAIVAPTTSGNTPRACAKYRPRKPIVAIADDEFTAAQLNLEWGVQATVYDPGTRGLDYIDRVIVQARDFAGLESGTKVVVTAGPTTGHPGATNLIALREIP